MTLHETVSAAMTRYIDERAECAIISPAAIAAATLKQFAGRALDPHLEWASLEHFKAMARKVLAHRYADTGESNAAYLDQGELFSGHLQDRYPLPRRKGEEPVYKLREHLTDDEVRWNLRSLRRSADARLSHADALEAWHQSRQFSDAA